MFLLKDLISFEYNETLLRQEYEKIETKKTQLIEKIKRDNQIKLNEISENFKKYKIASRSLMYIAYIFIISIIFLIFGYDFFKMIFYFCKRYKNEKDRKN